MNKLPKITVVTPSYNQGQFLRDTIESVINQNYPNLEYFVIDGGSTDNSVDIIREYEDKIDWWVSEKDKGQSDALFKGFEHASGDLIGWLNSDDVYFPEALKRVGKAYVKNPEVSIYAGGTARGAQNNGAISVCSLPSSPWTWFSHWGFMPFGQMGSFYSLNIYRKTGGINKNLFQIMDRDLWIRLLREHHKAVTVPGLIGFIRFHQGAKSSPAFPKHRKIRKQEISDFMERYNIPHFKYSQAKIFSKILRHLTGGYLKSWLFTIKYKNLTMKQIWQNYNNQ